MTAMITLDTVIMTNNGKLITCEKLTRMFKRKHTVSVIMRRLCSRIIGQLNFGVEDLRFKSHLCQEISPAPSPGAVFMIRG